MTPVAPIAWVCDGVDINTREATMLPSYQEDVMREQCTRQTTVVNLFQALGGGIRSWPVTIDYTAMLRSATHRNSNFFGHCKIREGMESLSQFS